MSNMRWLLAAMVLAAGFSMIGASAEEKKPADPKKKEPKDMNADEANEAGLCPVCKGEFKPVYHVDYKDKEYKFRSRECSKKFSANPTQYGAMGKDWKPPVDTSKPAEPAKTEAPKKTK